MSLERLIRLVLKELTDNALDTGANVKVGEIEGGGYYVEDDGEGLDPNEVADLFSVSRPLSSTKMFRMPTRGALGNGLRVATGAVLASEGSLTVETHGVKLDPQATVGGWDDSRQAHGLEGQDRNAHRDQLRPLSAARRRRPHLGRTSHRDGRPRRPLLQGRDLALLVRRAELP